MVRGAKSVTVRVPGSTSNLGSGFDTLGLAVNLRNEIRVSAAGKKGVQIISAVPPEEREAAQEMVGKAADEFFRRSGRAPFGIEVHLSGKVPVARGLGYSATVRLGVVAGLNSLAGALLDQAGLLELTTALEGHPDNASPALFGGFTASGKVGHRVRCLRFWVSPKLKLVTLFPRFKISTEKARQLLPASLSRADAAHGLNRAALITAAFASQDYEALRGCFDDRVHQPYREPLIPGLGQVIRAGEEAGAIGGFLSGSGSAIICLTLKNPRAVAAAMQRELTESETKVLVADNKGFNITTGAYGKTSSSF